MKHKSSIRPRFATKLFLSHFFAVFLVSGSVGTFFYDRAIENMMYSLRSRLQNSAALLSEGIDARDLDAIRTPADTGREIYRSTLERLRRMRRTNPDIAFLYIMRKEEGRVHFVIDSDETEKQAEPGREYDDAPSLMLTGFHEPSVDDKLLRDEWGVFLSGYAPLRNGGGQYLIGIDMRANEVESKLSQLRLVGVISLLASILLALLFGLSFSRGLSRRVQALMRRCQEIASGRLDGHIEHRTFDEFDELVDAFNMMSDELAATRGRVDNALEELRQAGDQLEIRVLERTGELERALEKVNVLSGLLPICASCKKIRDDQGYWQQVEHFMTIHTDARFTHGLCPDCAVKLYGHILNKNDILKDTKT
ncbi:MAG: HAMP domain-containing protein [Spirochaetes bacterium]|nr:MAG: HAMP domain-containing protein [Spirochaetota bacterium]